MKRNILLFSLLTMGLLLSCQDYTYLFRQNAQGTYELLSDPSKIISIDHSGSMAGTPESEMFFYQGVSDIEAIYTKKNSSIKYYIPIKINNLILYSNIKSKSSYNVSFEKMMPFAKKIS